MRSVSKNFLSRAQSAKRLVLILKLLLGVGLQGFLHAQTPISERLDYYDATLGFKQRPLTVITYSTASLDSNLSQLNIAISFVNDELQFVTTKDKKFRADFLVKLVILNSEGSKVDSVNWQGFVLAQNFKETIATTIRHTTRGEISLAPGEYRYRVELVDLETRRAKLREGTATVRDFSGDSVLLSDIAILDAQTLAQTRALKNQEPLADSLHYAFFEIYNLPLGDSAVVQYEISEPMSGEVVRGRQVIASEGRITKQILAIEEPNVISDATRIKLSIAANDTTHELERQVVPGPSPAKPQIDLKDAIEKLIYIAKGDELKRLRKAKGEEQALEFQKFWEKRDPTPGTAVNEYYEEYYRRIEYANKTFGSNDRGWRSDRGMIFVKLGPPDYINRPLNFNEYSDSFSPQRVYIVWQYINLARRVVFLFDAGEYRIVNYHEIFDIINDEMRL